MKEEKLAQEEKYMWAVLDGVREKVIFHFVDRNLSLASLNLLTTNLKQFQVGNFRVEPPGLFRGRGEHPKVYFAAFVLT